MLISDKRQNEDDTVLALDYDMSHPEDRRAYRLHQLIDQFPGNGNRGCFIDLLVVSKPTHEMVIRLADSLLDLEEVACPDIRADIEAPVSYSSEQQFLRDALLTALQNGAAFMVLEAGRANA